MNKGIVNSICFCSYGIKIKCAETAKLLNMYFWTKERYIALFALVSQGNIQREVDMRYLSNVYKQSLS